MRMNQGYFKVITIWTGLSLLGSTFLSSCANQSREEELEQRAAELQEKLDKEIESKEDAEKKAQDAADQVSQAQSQVDAAEARVRAAEAAEAAARAAEAAARGDQAAAHAARVDAEQARDAAIAVADEVRDRARGRVDAAEAARGAADAERDAAVADRDAAVRERDAAVVASEVAQRDRAAALAEAEIAHKAAEQAKAEAGSARAEELAARGDQVAAQVARDQAERARAEAIALAEGALERAGAAEAARRAAVYERDGAVLARDAAHEARDAAVAARDAAVAASEVAQRDRAAAQEEAANARRAAEQARVAANAARTAELAAQEGQRIAETEKVDAERAKAAAVADKAAVLKEVADFHQESQKALAAKEAELREAQEERNEAEERLGESQRSLRESEASIVGLERELRRVNEEIARIRSEQDKRSRDEMIAGLRYKKDLLDDSPSLSQLLKLFTPEERVIFCSDKVLSETKPKNIESWIKSCATHFPYQEDFLRSLVGAQVEGSKGSSSTPNGASSGRTSAAPVKAADAAASGGDLTPFKSVLSKLNESHSASRGHLWGAAQVSLGDPGSSWIVSSPQYADAKRLELDGATHSKNFLDAWRGAIESGEHYVDITTLSVPEEVQTMKGEWTPGFMTALEKSILFLDGKKKPITIRILFGTNSPQLVQTVNVNDLLSKLTTGLSRDSKLKISIGTYTKNKFRGGRVPGGDSNKTFASWNHSKIVAVDGRFMFTGGHNLYQTYLVDPNNTPLDTSGKRVVVGPVHDLSVKLKGSIAGVGHRFADEMWNWTCTNVDKQATWIGWIKSKVIMTKSAEVAIFDGSKQVKGRNSNRCLQFYQDWSDSIGKASSEASAEGEADSFNVIAIGRLGNIHEDGDTHRALANPSEAAMLHMVNQAKNAIYIAQQAFLPLYSAPLDLKDFESKFTKGMTNALWEATQRGVHVFILTSSTEEDHVGQGNFGYTSRFDRIRTYQYFKNRFIDSKNPALNPQQKSAGLKSLFTYLHVLPTANQNDPVPNHSKVLIVDGKVGYVGSHNLYDDSHAEFGAIFGETETRELLLDYFAPLWIASVEYDTLGGELVRSFEVVPSGSEVSTPPGAGGGAAGVAVSTEPSPYAPGDFVLVRRSNTVPGVGPVDAGGSAAGAGGRDGGRGAAAGAVRDYPSQMWTLGRIMAIGSDHQYTCDLDLVPLTTRESRYKIVQSDGIALVLGGDLGRTLPRVALPAKRAVPSAAPEDLGRTVIESKATRPKSPKEKSRSPRSLASEGRRGKSTRHK